MTWRDCEILNERSGKPYIVLHGELAAWFAERGLKAHVSVTDESDYVSTFVVVETLAPGGDGPPELGGGSPFQQRRPD